MKRIYLGVMVTFTLVSVGCGVSQSGSEVKGDKDDQIFTEELDANREGKRFSQIVLGLTDVYLAQWLWADDAQPRDPRVGVLKSADAELNRVMSLLTEEEQDKMIAQVKETMEYLGKDSDQYEELAEELSGLTQRQVIASESKAKALASAQEQVAKAREALLNQNRKLKTVGGRVMGTVRRAGSIIFMTDLFGRMYVWHALDKNPTLSPVLTVVAHYGEGVVFEEILKSVDGASQSDRNKQDYIDQF